MNRRMALVAAGAIALAGVGILAAQQLGVSERRVTLKSRILAYNEKIKSMEPRPRREEIRAHVTTMMGDYFRLGMSYEEVLETLEENDLKIYSSSINTIDSRFNEPVYFDVSIISVLKIPTWSLLSGFYYRIFFGFKNNGLDVFRASRIYKGF